jgi:hypothetical protein
VRLRFVAAGKGSYQFDTGVLRGTLRRGGKSLGLTEVVHGPTGVRLDKGHGLFGHYRVFAGDKRFGNGAWYWPSQSKLLPDGAVRVDWPAAEGRPFEMTAVYRWAGPAALDLETTVRAKAALPTFESFLACYFSPAFPASEVYAKGDDGPAFVTAERKDGVWQMFPRDADAVKLIQDGRWKQPPSPVDWAIRPPLAAPLGIRRAAKPGLIVAVMARPQDCFAVATPFAGEGHRSLYLSQFGRGLRAGESLTARTRLVVLSSSSPEDAVKAYREFIEASE